VKSDAEIRDDVIDELRWDPQISDADAIGVAVQDGAVTLTGHVPSYAEKLAAARAVERVYGVLAVANDLTVKLADAPRDDSDIATAIAHVLEHNVQIPEGRTPGCRTAGSSWRVRWTMTTSAARSSGWSARSAA
jgi:BON domain